MDRHPEGSVQSRSSSPDHTRQMFEQQKKEIRVRYDKLVREYESKKAEAKNVIDRIKGLSPETGKELEDNLTRYTREANLLEQSAMDKINEQRIGKEVLDALSKFENKCRPISILLSEAERMKENLRQGIKGVEGEHVGAGQPLLSRPDTPRPDISRPDTPRPDISGGDSPISMSGEIRKRVNKGYDLTKRFFETNPDENAHKKFMEQMKQANDHLGNITAFKMKKEKYPSQRVECDSKISYLLDDIDKIHKNIEQIINEGNNT